MKPILFSFGYYNTDLILIVGVDCKADEDIKSGLIGSSVRDHRGFVGLALASS